MDYFVHANLMPITSMMMETDNQIHEARVMGLTLGKEGPLPDPNPSPWPLVAIGKRLSSFLLKKRCMVLVSFILARRQLALRCLFYWPVIPMYKGVKIGDHQNRRTVPKVPFLCNKTRSKTKSDKKNTQRQRRERPSVWHKQSIQP